MIRLETLNVYGFEETIHGMRNPMNSWDKSDSGFCIGESERCDNCEYNPGENSPCRITDRNSIYVIGPNDLKLMKQLSKAGSDHAKFRRMIVVYANITAPLYWWKEFDTYKVGTVSNSCSTMHKIADKEFTLEDFSCEHLISDGVFEEQVGREYYEDGVEFGLNPVFAKQILNKTINALNMYRSLYLRTNIKKYWWQMIQLLPSSYNQKRTVMMNYEVLHNIYKSRKDHKLDEWHDFCDWIKGLPYAEGIIYDNT